MTISAFFIILVGTNQLLGMRSLLTIFFILCLIVKVIPNTIDNDLDRVTSLLAEDKLEETKSLILELKPTNDNSENFNWLVKSNYYLGYIYKEEGDFGKSIIYYLEAIRYAENSLDPSLNSDLISLYNRCGVIYKKFKAIKLAKDYYEKGLELAYETNDSKFIVLIKYNLAGLLIEEENYHEGINILESETQNLEKGSKKYFDYHNRIATAYYKQEDYANSLRFYEFLEKDIDLFNHKKQGYVYHNKALTLQKMNQIDLAEDYFNYAIESKSKHKDQKILLSSYIDYSVLLTEKGDNQKALQLINRGEAILNRTDQIPENFKLYKLKANYLFELSRFDESKKYQDLYAENINEYLVLQKELQETDKKYNMDLITRRYFDEVAKQERIASILFYSKLISGSLLALLLLNIGYTRYQKIKLRKSITQELIDLKVIN